MAEHGITLTRTDQANHVSGRSQGYRMQVVASAGLAMTNRIFLLRVGTVDPDLGTRTAKFINICSPSDIAQYPAAFTDGVEFYRSASIDLVFRSPSLADTTWDLITADVAELTETLDLMDEMATSTVVRIGATPSSSSSS